MMYNLATTDLDNVKVWWMVISLREETKPDNIDKLVGSPETVLQSELTGWVQQMEDALAKSNQTSIHS